MSNASQLHNPLPSPARAVYGFVLYAASAVAFGLYLVWAYCPSVWLKAIGIEYYPQKYWALVMPVYFAMVFVFLIALNVGISLVLTPDLSSMTTIQDRYSRPLAAPYGVNLSPGRPKATKSKPNTIVPAIPAIGDIPAYRVSALLFSNQLSTVPSKT